MDKATKSTINIIMDPLVEKLISAVAILMFTMFAVLAAQPVMLLGLLFWQ